MYNRTNTSIARSAFSDDGLATASPARVLVKCFDRLDADLERAQTAIESKDHEAANTVLAHAQDLLGEMVGMLDLEVWEHVDSLLAVYDYVLRLLAVGNIEKHAAPVREARHLLAEIGSAFRTAADEIERSGIAASPEAPSPAFAEPETPAGSAPPQSRGFSVLA